MCAQHYMYPEDANDPTRLPNIETFQAAYSYCPDCGSLSYKDVVMKGYRLLCEEKECRDNNVTVLLDRLGWFHWFCVPGCLADSEPMGPFDSEALALEDARRDLDDDLAG